MANTINPMSLPIEHRVSIVRFLLGRYTYLADTCYPDDPRYPEMDMVANKMKTYGYELKFKIEEGGYYAESFQ